MALERRHVDYGIKTSLEQCHVHNSTHICDWLGIKGMVELADHWVLTKEKARDRTLSGVRDAFVSENSSPVWLLRNLGLAALVLNKCGGVYVAPSWHQSAERDPRA